jgi:cytochrome c biogenesis protein CcdA
VCRAHIGLDLTIAAGAMRPLELLLFVYSLGMGIPFVVAGLFAG